MSAALSPHPSASVELEDFAQALRAAALAVSSAQGDAVFADLVRTLAGVLRVEIAFIALRVDDDPASLEMRAMIVDGEASAGLRYELDGTPCATVIGRQFCAYAEGVRERFPADTAFARLGVESYAAFPISSSQGRSLGLIAAVSRRPMRHVERIETILQIYAVRAAAEIERLHAERALRESEQSYRAIFDAAEDAIFIHDWDTGKVVDVNPKACQTYGYTRDELRRVKIRDISAGDASYTEADAKRWLELAREDRCPPFEWHRRNKDGSLHWDEVRLKPVTLRGRRHILAFTRDITERKQAEQALQAREEQYRAIFEAASDAFVLWNASLEVVDVNPAFLRMYGFTRENHRTGGGYPAHYPADYVQSRMDAVRRALAGEEVHAETVALRADGSPFEIEMRMIPVRYRGEPHVLAVARDITERREREQALRIREEQYRAIFEASSDAFVLWDTNLQVVDVNPAFLRMYRFEPGGQPPAGGYPPHFPREYVQARQELVRRALAGEETHVETVALRADGSPFDVDLRVIPVRHRGRPHVLAVVRDITERRERELALQRSEARLRATVEAAFDSVIGMDGDGRIVEFNAAAERCFGHRRADVLGRRLADTLIPARFRASHEHGLARFLQVGHGPYVGRLVETTAMRADGSEFPVELAISVARVPEGSIFVGHLRDITARRQAETQRAELENQLRQAQKMEAIGQLTGGIAHDFNNILTSVIGYVVLASERAEGLGDARLSRQLDQAHLAAQRARELISQMLTFARRRHGERRALALGAVARQAVQLLRATLPSTIEIDAMELDADPEEATPPVAADAVQLEQVLFNLCINARDSIVGTGRIRVRLRETSSPGWHCASCRARVPAGRWVELSVADSGCGIPADVLERMFDPFFSTKDVGRGSGMGLAMVHGIVHDHGGHLRVDTALGAGSTFAVLLPPATEHVAAQLPAAFTAAHPAPPPRLRGRVLVVEDDPMVGDYMRELLEGWGLEVVLQRDPVLAAAWVEDPEHTLELVITDQTMPRMTGLELARRAAALRPGLPVILYTGDAAEFDAAELQRSGVQELLRKPIVADGLRAVVRRLIGPG